MRSLGRWTHHNFSKDADEFLTTCRELLEIIGLTESHGVRYAIFRFTGKGVGEDIFRIFAIWISSSNLGDFF